MSPRTCRMHGSHLSHHERARRRPACVAVACRARVSASWHECVSINPANTASHHARKGRARSGMGKRAHNTRVDQGTAYPLPPHSVQSVQMLAHVGINPAHLDPTHPPGCMPRRTMPRVVIGCGMAGTTRAGLAACTSALPHVQQPDSPPQAYSEAHGPWASAEACACPCMMAWCGEACMQAGHDV